MGSKPAVSGFFVYSRVAYTIFPHTFSEKWHLCQDRREGMCHFRLGYEEKPFLASGSKLPCGFPLQKRTYRGCFQAINPSELFQYPFIRSYSFIGTFRAAVCSADCRECCVGYPKSMHIPIINLAIFKCLNFDNFKIYN